jgi:hypothetical protein
VRIRRLVSGDPFPPLLLASLLLGATSLLLPWAPSFDPWGWLLWGREIVTSGMRFSTVGYPSWKPLPVGFTTLFSLVGDIAPSLWLTVARAGAFLAALGAYRLAARLGGPIAGAFAVAGLALTPKWLTYFAGGDSEPLLVALVLWAVERHVTARRGQALGLGFAAALLRPEVWPFLAAYAFFYVRREPRGLPIAALLLLAIPPLWLVPEWIGAGNAFHGTTLARFSMEAQQTQRLAHPVLAVVSRGFGLLLVPLWLGAVAELVHAWRTRERLPLALGAGALAWIALVAGMTAVGYAGVARFMLPAAAIACVLGAAGAWRVVERIGKRPALAAALLAAACVPFAVSRTTTAVSEARTAETHDELQDELNAMVSRLGGPVAVATCGPLLMEHQFTAPLAWRLRVSQSSLEETHARLFFLRRRRVLHGYARAVRRGRRRGGRVVRLAGVGPWEAVVIPRDVRCPLPDHAGVAETAAWTRASL